MSFERTVYALRSLVMIDIGLYWVSWHGDYICTLDVEMLFTWCLLAMPMIKSCCGIGLIGSYNEPDGAGVGADPSRKVWGPLVVARACLIDIWFELVMNCYVLIDY